LLNGVLRYMQYDFRVASVTPFKTRKDLVAAFKAQPFRRIDSSVVPGTVFDSGIPTAFSDQTRLKPRVYVNLSPKVAGQASIPLHNIYDYWHQPVGPFLLPQGGPSDSSPASEREAFVEAHLSPRPEFQASYELPYYLRYDYKDLSSFVKGFDWHPSTNPPNSDGEIGWSGARHLYRLGVPVVDPSNDKKELIYDYVSGDGTTQEFNLSKNPN